MPRSQLTGRLEPAQVAHQLQVHPAPWPVGGPRATVGDIPLACVTLEDTKRAIVEAVDRGPRPPLHLVTVNLDHLALASQDTAFGDVIRGCELPVADGMGAVWLSRLQPEGPAVPERVTGATLTEWMVDGGIADASLFLLGSTAEVLDRVQSRAGAASVRIAGTATPPRLVFQSAQLSLQLVRRINAARPDVLLVALGAPLQEVWIDRWRDQLDVSVAMGVGGSFDMAAGLQRRSPEALQRMGLEWLYRLSREPRRLWQRYLLRDVPFLLHGCARSLTARIAAASSPGR
jgi:N-acetylglucosaminyldiphosphoundecaprenol N-acetyl-beta-D-mannosaminyltransferase